jgi:hypothetical protein
MITTTKTAKRHEIGSNNNNNNKNEQTDSKKMECKKQ